MSSQDLLNEKSIVVLPVAEDAAWPSPSNGYDMFVAEWLAQQDKRFPVVCLPTLKYAHYPLSTEGTVSVESLTFIKVVRDIVIASSGTAKKFLVITPFTTYPCTR